MTAGESWDVIFIRSFSVSDVKEVNSLYADLENHKLIENSHFSEIMF